MGNIDGRHITAGMERAVKESPLFLPTAESVRAFAVESRIKEAKTREKSSFNRADQDYVFVSKENPAYDLAERWVKESRDLGLFPSSRTPANIAKARITELVAFFNSKQFAGDL